MFRVKDLLMNEVVSESGGGGAAIINQESVETIQEPVVNEEVETIESIKAKYLSEKAEKEALFKNKAEILAEKKRIEAENRKFKENEDKFQKLSVEEQKKALLEAEDYKKLYEILTEARKEDLEKLTQLEKVQQEKEAKEEAVKLELIEREKQEQIKMVKSAYKLALKKELGNVEFYDEDVVDSLLDWSKAVKDDSNEYKVNLDGVKQNAKLIMSKYSWTIKTEPTQIPQKAAKEKDANSGLTLAQKMKKAGMI